MNLDKEIKEPIMASLGSILLFFLYLSSVFAADCPLIFIHGHKSEAVPHTVDADSNIVGDFTTWHPINPDSSLKYHSAMTKIIDSHYSGYTAGSPLNCDMNSALLPTGGETRKIYNFSYYHPDGVRGVISLDEDSVLVYFLHGYDKAGRKVTYLIAPFTGGYPPSSYDSAKYWPRYVPGIKLAWVSGNLRWVCSDAASNYIDSWEKGKYAKWLAEFIDKVLTATGAQKVDIVAHSMGGLVARVAIKNYGCDGKSQKNC